jgi:hypothetical protein
MRTNQALMVTANKHDEQSHGNYVAHTIATKVRAGRPLNVCACRVQIEYNGSAAYAPLWLVGSLRRAAQKRLEQIAEGRTVSPSEVSST